MHKVFAYQVRPWREQDVELGEALLHHLYGEFL
jgi:hypothetical protein